MEGLLVFIGLIVGGAVGAVVAWLLAERRFRSHHNEMLASASVAGHRVEDLNKQIASERDQTSALRDLLSESEKSAATLTAQLQAAQQNLEEQKELLDDAHVKLREAFASVSSEALAKNNEAFLHLAKERFAHLSTQATG